MFSHITIGTQDLTRAVTFYDAALAPLGIQRVPGTKYAGWASEPDRRRRYGSAGHRMASLPAMATAGWWPSPHPPAPR